MLTSTIRTALSPALRWAWRMVEKRCATISVVRFLVRRSDSCRARRASSSRMMRGEDEADELKEVQGEPRAAAKNPERVHFKAAFTDTGEGGAHSTSLVFFETDRAGRRTIARACVRYVWNRSVRPSRCSRGAAEGDFMEHATAWYHPAPAESASHSYPS